MYLARVLVGEYAQGRQGILTPPAKSSNNLTDTYDTVVNNVSNPEIVVAFYDWQCYPEYLITFQWRDLILDQQDITGKLFMQTHSKRQVQAQFKDQS